MGYGADPSAWGCLDLLHGLTEDLLPVVSNPKGAVSEKSALRDIGKVPSIYNGDGCIVGLSRWTRRKTSPSQIEEWAKNSDYGICIQTRRLRALDIDVEDSDRARAVARMVCERLGADAPVRYREGSGKCLVPFWCESGDESEDLYKRVVKVDGGMVEFLASGQQFIAHGTHPSGARYEWSGDVDQFPRLDVESFEALWSALVEAFGVEPPMVARGGARRKGTGVSVDVGDPLIAQLDVLSEGSGGQLNITCPFEHEHTTESSESATTYFPAGVGGYVGGHFKCLHAHCMERTDDDFMQALGIRALGGDAFDVLPPAVVDNEENNVENSGGVLPVYARAGNGQPLATLDNLVSACTRGDLCGFSVRQDVFYGEVVLCPWRDGAEVDGAWRALKDTDYTMIRHRLEAVHGFKPIPAQLMREVVQYVAELHKIDTAKLWANGLEWDGVARCEQFFVEYMGCMDSELVRAAGRYVWSAMAGRAVVPGVKADIVPILIGKQGAMKSTAVAAMAPRPEWFCEVSFDENEDNRLRRIKGKLVAEIGEMKGLWAAALENVKAFVTREADTWVPKYKEQAVTYKRRCIFVGTSNHYDILNDATGSRRFLPIEVGVAGVIELEKIKRDCAQLWAEGVALFGADGVCFKDVERRLAAHNENYRAAEPWEDMIRDWLFTPGMGGLRPVDDEDGVNVTDVLTCAIGIPRDRVNAGTSRKASECLRVLGMERRRVRGLDDDADVQKNAHPVRRWFLSQK